MVGAAIVAGLLTAGFQIAGNLVRGRQPELSWASLRPPIETIDIATGLLLIAILAMALVRTGWRDSAARRLLFGCDASTRTDVFYAVLSETGLGTVAASIVTFGLSDLIGAVADSGSGLGLFVCLPLYLSVPLLILMNSFAAYWLHRVMHLSVLWHFHAVHHAGNDFNTALTFRNHPVDSLIQSFSVTIPMFLGFSNDTLLIALIIVYANGIYCHSDLPTSSFLQRWILFGPTGHGIHHSDAPACYNSNFGNLVFWDRMFGTYKADASSLSYGCEDPRRIYQSGHPLRDMFAVNTLWLNEIWSAMRSSRYFRLRSSPRATPSPVGHLA